MKTSVKILLGFLLFVVIIIVGLNLYFTDDRLKQTVMPYVEQSVGRSVQVESMSLTFFQTFPRPGISINKLSIPGETSSDTLLSLDEFVASIEIFSLLSDQINIAEIQLQNPQFTYRISKDSTSNIDFLLSEETDTTAESETYQFNIPYFSISNGKFGFVDATSNTNVQMNELDADISFSYADLINSRLDIELGGLSARVGSSQYVNKLPVSLSQSSTIDMKNETITLKSGTFSIRGLALDLSGSIKNWSSNTPAIDLQFSSSSDNFGELLRLAPADYQEQVAELETRGNLSISGNVSGNIGGEQLPSFSADITVKDGYLKNPDLPEAIQNIQLRASASNELINLQEFNATAGSNSITVSGQLKQPLAENASFNLNLNGDVDLTTVEQFYSLEDFSIERLEGKLTVNATADGQMNKPEQAVFDADLNLANGLLQYAEVPNPIENIAIDAKATEDLVTINSFYLKASQNELSLQGNIANPMDSTERSVDLTTDLFFDLATIKEFYPIDEDTLQLRGELTAQAVLKGKAEQIERAVESGSIELKNGYINSKRLGQPITNITLSSSLKGNRLTVNNASFQSGQNDLALSGAITDYLSENPVVDLRVKGNSRFEEIQNYYDLQPAISELTGTGKLDLSVQGPIQEPGELKLNGSAVVNNFNMSGDSLVQPVRNLNGELKLSPQSVDLTNLGFLLGSSDLKLSGSLQNYIEYLKPEEDRKTTPNLSGSFESILFNMDELINWEDTSASTPIPIELPDLNSSVTAGIDTLIVTGVTMTDLKAEAGTNPSQISLNKASINLFDGSASGSFVWNVPQPDRTNLDFNGELNDITISSFFREYQVLGEKSIFHKHVTGSFSAKVDYHTVLDLYLDPVIPTTRMDGTFSMTKARIKGHPLQEKIAALLKADELNNIAIDKSTNRFSIENSVMTIENLGLTSGDIGAEMSGTRHLLNNNIDYKLKVFLPKRFGDRIASVISAQAVKALTQENGTIMLPLRVTGTQNNPTVRPDQEVIKPILEEMLKKKAGDVLKGIFGN